MPTELHCFLPRGLNTWEWHKVWAAVTSMVKESSAKANRSFQNQTFVWKYPKWGKMANFKIKKANNLNKITWVVIHFHFFTIFKIVLIPETCTGSPLGQKKRCLNEFKWCVEFTAWLHLCFEHKNNAETVNASNPHSGYVSNWQT